MNQVWEKGLVALVLTGLVVSFPTQTFAEAETQNIIKFGTAELGIQAGYWQAFEGLGNNNSNRSAVFVLPQIGIVVTDKIALGLFSGAVEVLGEPVVASFHEPFSATLLGFSIIGRYNFLGFGRWMPYWDFGAGVSWTDLAPRISEQSTPLEFLLEIGPGLGYFVTEDFAVTGSLKLHHLSNANIGRRNIGINAVLVSIGVAYYIDEYL
jgi:hypothetical protein